ncbi:MAG TPA: VCBS repeat-containing protein [Kofleriaceae bacterium]|jgi:hypothetical protein
MRTVVALVCLAACTTFEPIERNVCGNGLLEPGEDCDSPDPSCVACAVACSTGSDCPNAAYTCGVDGLCHAPSGLFAQPTPQVLALVDEMQIADIDRDGIGDVLGVSSTQLDVRFGDPTASLTTDSSLATSQQTATVAFGDVDGDGVTDATIVTQDGIVTFTSPYGALTAAPSQLPIGSNAQLLASFPIGSLAFGVIVAGASSPILDIVQLTNNGETSAYDADCLVPVGDVATSTIDSYTVTLGSDGSTDTLVAIYAKGGASWCVESIHIALNGAVNGLDVTPAGAPPARRPAFAELDSAMCPSLIAGTGSASVLDFTGSLVVGTPSHCDLATTGTQLAAPNATDAVPVGHIPLTPAIPGYASDLLVLQNGVYGMQTGLTEIFKSGPTITSAASGDLDGDGAVDAALFSSAQADFQVIYRKPNAPLGTPAFIEAPVQTAGAVGLATIADFDGNGLADIAYTEQLLDHTQLSVAFGEPGNNLTQIVEGAFSSVYGLTPIGIADSSDPESVIADLIVVDGLGSGTSATLLHGSPERTMFSYFEPRATNDPARQSPMRQVVTGYFGGGSTQFPDVVSMLPPATTAGSGGTGANGGTSSVLAYRLDGTPAGLVSSDPIDLAEGEPVGDLADCSGTGPAGSGSPCIRDATVLGWQTGSAHDVIVGIDHLTPPRAYKVDPWSFVQNGKLGSAAASVLAIPTTDVSNGMIAHTAFAFDVDGDGAPELVLAFAPAETASAAGSGVVESCEMDETGTPTSCTDLDDIVEAAAPDVTQLTCVDAAAGVFAAAGPDVAPPAPALLVLCHDPSGTSLLARVSGTTATLVATGLPPLRQIVAGDVTGDGIADIVAIRGDSGGRAYTVLVQCSSRDLACQAGAVTQ